ncbi:MAG: FAD-binding oxidoreductase [Gemmatimonadaceae bacterium]
MSDSAPTAPSLDAPPGFRGAFRTDPEARAVYAEAAGIARITPRAVAAPAGVDDVALLARWASTTGVPLVPRGAGSGMAAGATGPGVVVDVSRLDAIAPVDVEARSIRVGAGALCGAVDAAARAQGLRFPVDPSSRPFCTVGGMAAANAAGPHTLAFGATRAWVTAIECIFADGSRAEVRRGAPDPEAPAIARFRRDVAPALASNESSGEGAGPATRKDSSGYALREFARSGDLVDLLVGSEGTLAIFTALELALLPVAGATSSVLGAFRSLDDAVTAASRAAASGAVACELLDRTFLDVAASGGQLPSVAAGADAVLLAEVEGDDASHAAGVAERLRTIFADAGATAVELALDPESEHGLWELRHAASPILARVDPALRSMQFIEDGAVPVARLPEYVRGVREILARHDTRGVIFGHAGDGHAHVNPLVDVSRPGWRERVQAILAEQVALTGTLHGTLAGEHGDGRLRTPMLGATHDAATRARFAAVKRAFDPAGVLNPGVIVAPAGTEPLAFDIKYDPALPPPPPAAAAVLRRVEEERGYGRFRLQMLDEAKSGDGH